MHEFRGLLPIVVLGLAGAASAQLDVLYYKFDETGGKKTAAGSTYVASGYQNTMTNASFTVAWAMKQRTAPPSLSYFFYSNLGFRAFTGGVAGRGIVTRNWNTAAATPTDLQLTTNV